MVHLPNGIEKLGNNIHLFVFGGGQGENTAFQKNIEQFEKKDGAAAKIAKELKAQLEKQQNDASNLVVYPFYYEFEKKKLTKEERYNQMLFSMFSSSSLHETAKYDHSPIFKKNHFFATNYLAP